ncbi:hypothetical protein NDU88_007382 [Pleurodeles waltl]|uniref:Uncharacterized protein n=1 Tax=Pleurodeles waltl TaxID=8319 RepID=A0AAV7QLW2_PLEWA|nr:hypothetical protein NDU88_007382 [Pleurodeles waltl]
MEVMGVISPVWNGYGASAGEEEDRETGRTKNQESGLRGDGEMAVCGAGSWDEDETSETREDGNPEGDGVTEDPVD